MVFSDAIVTSTLFVVFVGHCSMFFSSALLVTRLLLLSVCSLALLPTFLLLLPVLQLSTFLWPGGHRVPFNVIETVFSLNYLFPKATLPNSCIGQLARSGY